MEYRGPQAPVWSADPISGPGPISGPIQSNLDYGNRNYRAPRQRDAGHAAPGSAFDPLWVYRSEGLPSCLQPAIEERGVRGGDRRLGRVLPHLYEANQALLRPCSKIHCS